MFSTKTSVIWKTLGKVLDIISLNPQSFRTPTKIIKDNIELVEGKSIVNAFNDFFANIGSELANSIPAATISLLSYLPAQKPNNLLFSAGYM